MKPAMSLGIPAVHKIHIISLSSYTGDFKSRAGCCMLYMSFVLIMHSVGLLLALNSGYLPTYMHACMY